MKKIPVMLSLMLAIFPTAVWASEAAGAADTFAISLLWIAVILMAAKIFGSLAEKMGQSSVLGELIIGVILGNAVLLGLTVFEPIKLDPNIAWLAQFGVAILLFQVGLESTIQKMKQVGVRAFLVACVGVVAPFALCTCIVAPLLLPGLSFGTYLFLGATLTATSVSIPARMFQDLKKLDTPEAQIILGAAVIDDVIGLIILAVVTAIAQVGSVSIASVGWITAEATLFLVGSIIVGQLLAPFMGKHLSKMHPGQDMKFTMAICFCLVLAFLAQQIGLAPIVGGFAAGLILVPSYFSAFKDPPVVNDVKEIIAGLDESSKEKILATVKQYSDSHVEDLIRPVGWLTVPIFFVLIGMNVRLETMFDLPVLLIALAITVAAFVGKMASGLVAGKVDKWIVGVGMVPRGEVGLIFAVMGKSMGIITDEIYSIVVIMVILTTLCTPPILAYLLKRKYKKG
ncbi:MAG: cation:proton antiporter [Candidatus Paceibacterota bacterium]|jgi:Kef-type K+ transport system membrane component KefB